MQTTESLRAEHQRAHPVTSRTWSRTKRGPGRSPKDSRHGRGSALSVRARLAKRLRRRARAGVEVPLGLTTGIRLRPASVAALLLGGVHPDALRLFDEPEGRPR